MFDQAFTPTPTHPPLDPACLECQYLSMAPLAGKKR